jgi:hypothetical protein
MVWQGRPAGLHDRMEAIDDQQYDRRVISRCDLLKVGGGLAVSAWPAVGRLEQLRPRNGP